MRELRFDIDTEAQFRTLVTAPLPLGLAGSEAVRRLRRDLYLDTPDETLRRRGISCRLRCYMDDRRLFSLRVESPSSNGTPPTARIHSSRVRGSEAAEVLAERTGVVRRLRGVVDPATLAVRIAIEVEEYERVAGRDWLFRPRWRFRFEQIVVRDREEARAFQQLVVRSPQGDAVGLARIGDAIRETTGLHPVYADTRERAQFLSKWMRDPDDAKRPRRRDLVSLASRDWPAGTPPANPVVAAPPARRRARGSVKNAPVPNEPAQFLNSEIGHLEFISRVLALAEDSATPLGERLRYLAIVASNLDEFFMVRVAGLVHATEESIEEQAEDGLSPQEQLELIALRVPPLVARQSQCARDTLADLAKTGVRLLRWDEASAEARAGLRDRFRDEIYPELTPLAVTLSPGHPIPRLQHLSLALGATMTESDGGRTRFVNIELPARLPRFVRIADSNDYVPVEDVVRSSLDLLYPEQRVEEAHLFRVTRGGEMSLDERQGDDLLDIVSEATKQRPYNPVVRVEVERSMPGKMRQLVLDELQRERGGDGSRAIADVYEVEGLIDLRGLASLAPDGSAARYAQWAPVDPLPLGVPIWDVLRERERLIHHPFESFDATVLRLLRDAADDPDVTAIKITLYRTGDESPIAQALLDAAGRGKDVIAFVELKARFDEERNVNWARRLEEAGGRVVYGLIGLKNHAKVMLIVRREGEKRRRYAHVGTGNYNAVTARTYTDLSLLSADESLTLDLADFFNELTGSSKPPKKLTRGAIVAPKQMRRALVERIDREAGHARLGRPAAIRMKMNGLSEPDIVRALYEASRAGVEIDLVIRGLCTLRPGIPGLSERIRVVSVVGRFLEHSRAYYFANDGAPEYFIGSADLRTRNLRRRVELLAPVKEQECRNTLDRLLRAYATDAAAWRLQPHGGYARGSAAASVVQERWLSDTAAHV